ncbi:hypothetical protein [Pirellula sp. SH-Sr6A]|uniref:hypothetical protein n=1 Tax=Pirellula sp. SH-Sr6A TaxID=1632865 RepID=UPI0011BAE26D|nr:hypothetical protein [Pirellula sp. SH-Sr6A]
MLTRYPPLVTLFLLAAVACPSASAQPPNNSSRASRSTKNLIQPGYYTGLDLLADGQTMGAYQAFEEAYTQSRQAGNDRGIDSVPPLVMMGECLYLQGDIGGALQYFDAALNVSVQCSHWLSLLGPSAPVDRTDSRNKDPLWSPPNSRNAAMGMAPGVWQIRLGGANRLPERIPPSQQNSSPNNIPPSPPGDPIWIDALEVLRCQAIALRRRANLLGPLAKYNPLTPSLPSAFTLPPAAQPSEWIKSGASICSAIAALEPSTANEIGTQLKQQLSLGSGKDHPLTAIALLVLADFAVESNSFPAASEFALESSLSGARAGQPEHVEEAIELWSQCAFQNQLDYQATGKTLLGVSKWASGQSRLVLLRAQLEGVRQAALRGDWETVRKQSPAITAAILPKQILLPRMDAGIAYAQAKLAFAENNLATGIQKLEEALAILRGNSAMSSASTRLYQLQLTQYLIAENAISSEVGLAILSGLLDADRIGAWKTKVLEELVFQMADKLDARRLAVRLALDSNDLELQVDAWERWKSARFLNGSVLQGRLAELRRALHAPYDSVSAEESKKWESIRVAFPALAKNAKTLEEWTRPFATTPKPDLRKWSDEETKRWESVVKLSSVQESLLWSATLSPVAVPETLTPRWNRKTLFATLSDQDGVLAYYSLQGELHGYYVTKKEIRSWKIDESQNVGPDVRNLMAVCSKASSELPADFSKQTNALRRRWIPDEIWERMKSADRWIIAPDGLVWGFPLELFPLASAGEYEPALSRYRICYTPTLAALEPLIRPRPLARRERITLQSADFWDPNGGNGKGLLERSATLCGKDRTLDIPSNGAMVPSPYLKIASGHYTSLSPLRWDDPNRFPLVPGSDAVANQIAGWNPLPWGAPESIWLLGHAHANGEIPGAIEPGDEWLRWTLGLLSQGTRHIWISRWPVGGESTLSLLTQLQDNLEGAPFTEAWQRSVATVWLEEFQPTKEPIAWSQGKEPTASSRPIPGTHPGLWGGYLSIGDPNSPEGSR